MWHCLRRSGNILTRIAKQFTGQTTRTYSSIITKPTLIFEANQTQQKHHKIIGIASLALSSIFFAVNIGALIVLSDLDDESFKSIAPLHIVFPITLTLITLFIFGRGYIYPNRCIQSVTLLPQNRVVIGLFGYFGMLMKSRSKLIVDANRVSFIKRKKDFIECKVDDMYFRFTLKIQNPKCLIADEFNRVFTAHKFI